jgi:hypothetical protein
MSEVHRSAACPQPGQGFPVVSDELHVDTRGMCLFLAKVVRFVCVCVCVILMLGFSDISHGVFAALSPRPLQSPYPRALHVSRGTSRAQPRPRVAPPRLAPYRRLDAVHVRQPHHRHHPRPLRTQERAGHVRVALGDEGVVQRWHLGGAGRYLLSVMHG